MKDLIDKIKDGDFSDFKIEFKKRIQHAVMSKIDQRWKDMVESYNKQFTNEKKDTEKEAKSLLKYLRDEGWDDKQIKDYLEDGAALEKDGYTDQDVIETAHGMLNKK